MIRDGLLGSVVKLEYALTSDVSVWPDPLPNSVSDGLILLNGEWTTLDVNSDLGITTTSGAASIRFSIHRLSASSNLLFEQLAEQNLIFRATDAHGVAFIIGSPDFPAYLKYNGSTGNRSDSASGYSLEILMASPKALTMENTADVASLTYNGSILLYNNTYLTA